MIRSSSGDTPPDTDRSARILELALVAVVLVAPLPFASVVPRGRLALELLAAVVLIVWIVRAVRHGVALPARSILAGAIGLLALAMIQALPLGDGVVGRVSPRAVSVRHESRAQGSARDAEARILRADPESFDRPSALSLDPPATAGALRTGVALVVLLLAAATVAATRGLRTLCWALLVSAAFQGLYGLLVLVSGHPVIWNVAKRYYVDSATGTFVNRNHFAGFLALALPAGLALALSSRHAAQTVAGLKGHLLRLLGTEGSRRLIAGLLVTIGIAGLFLSFSRAGIALGTAALFATAILVRRRVRAGVVAALLVLAVGLVPLAQIGADRLASRFATTSEDFSVRGGRLVVWKDTARMLRAFPWTGVGFGSYAAAYPFFRSAEVRARYDHAHNDLLQLTAEGGFVALALVALLLIPLLRALLHALLLRSGPLALGLGAGFAAALLHALVDFNFHIPANAAATAVVAGSLLGAECNPPG